MRMGVRALGAMMVAACAAPASAETETIKTRVPQTHIDAVMNTCAKSAPRASCWCFVKKLNETADGQLTMDVIGQNNVDADPPQADVVKLLDRHGMRPSEAKAALDRTRPTFEKVLAGCG